MGVPFRIVELLMTRKATRKGPGLVAHGPERGASLPGEYGHKKAVGSENSQSPTARPIGRLELQPEGGRTDPANGAETAYAIADEQSQESHESAPLLI